MYQIGQFSKIFRITPKTLRHYDEIGLFKPAKNDSFTGYRYYSSEQFSHLNTILALKDMGLSLPEIKRIINHPERIEQLMRQKQSELEIQESKIRTQKDLIETYLSQQSRGNPMNEIVRIKTLPEVVVASMRKTIPSYDTLFTIMPEMGKEMARQEAVCAEPAYCFNIYHDAEYREKDIDIESCEAVVMAKEDSDLVTYKTIEEVKEAACIYHRGSYNTLRESYQILFAWIEHAGYKVNGLSRESYIDGIWNTSDETQWLTEIQIPVTKS